MGGYFDFKAFNTIVCAFLAACATATITGLFALNIAKKITKAIEDNKLKSADSIEDKRIAFQLQLEKERLNFQLKLERERMEFQRESEAQKQRMERFKTFYQEQIDACKELSELYVSAFDLVAIFIRTESSAEIRQKTIIANNAVNTFCNRNRWLFTIDLNNKANAFTDLVSHILNENITGEHPQSTVFLHELQIECEFLDASISSMLEKHDLSDVLNHGSTEETN